MITIQNKVQDLDLTDKAGGNMKKNPIYYDDVAQLLRCLSAAPKETLSQLLWLNKSDFDCLLVSMDKLLSAYLQVTDDLNELQEISE